MEVSSSVALAPIADWLFTFFNADPVVRSIQVVLGALASGLVFLVFYTTRDVMLRSKSLLFQLSCIVTVAVLPLVGFLLYLLVRPSQTIKQREAHKKISLIAASLQKGSASKLPGKTTIEKTLKMPGFAMQKKVKTEAPKKKSPELVPA